MKRLLLILLGCLLLLAACGGKDARQQTEKAAGASSSASSEEHDHNHINYKGLQQSNVTQEDMQTTEGREPDFNFESNGQTIYAYNDVSMDELHFTQVQYTFGEGTCRISCTFTGASGAEEAYQSYQNAMTALYGEPSDSAAILSWHDHTSNFIMLTKLNETTVQLAFYLNEA